MNHPGVFVLGDLSDDDRRHGMGMAMEQRPPRIIGDEVKSDLLEAALMVVLVKERPAPVTAKARIDLSFRQFPRGYWRYLLATALFGLFVSHSAARRLARDDHPDLCRVQSGGGADLLSGRLSFGQVGEAKHSNRGAAGFSSSPILALPSPVTSP